MSQENTNIIDLDYVKMALLVDWTEISDKTVISNTDRILALLELGINSAAYTNSYVFWNNALNYPCVAKVFQSYKAKTLRRYWVRLCENCDADKFINDNQEFLDKKAVKLKTLLKAIKSFIDSNSTESFPEYYENFINLLKKQKSKVINFEIPLLSRKRNK